MRKFRKIAALLVAMVMAVQLAPEVVCGAVESTFDLVIYPETPLDEVYFYSTRTDNQAGYYFGYIDGKIAIMDEDYNLVKKTEFNEYTSNNGSIGKIKDTQGFVAAKVVGEDERIYGILSSSGETIIPAEYAYMGMSLDRTLIDVGERQENGEILYGVWDSDCNEILPCEYPYVHAWGSDGDHTLIQIREDKGGPGTLLLDGKEFYKEEKPEEWEDDACVYRNEYSYCFAEYNGGMYIMIDSSLYKEYKLLDEEDMDKYQCERHIDLYSYSGNLIRTLSEKEYMDYYIHSELVIPDNIEGFDSDSRLGLKETGTGFIIYDQKTGKDIYKSKQGEYAPYNSERYGQFYFVNIYNAETFVSKTMIIESTSDEVRFYGNRSETFIQVNEENHKIVVIGKRGAENILPSPVPDSDPDKPSVTVPSPELSTNPSTKPSPSIKPDDPSGNAQMPDVSSIPVDTEKEAILEVSRENLVIAVKKSTTVKVNTDQDKVTARSENDNVAIAQVAGKNIKITIPKKAIKGSSTYIMVSAGDKNVKIKVTVKNKVKKIKPANKTVTLKKGKQISLKFKITAQEKRYNVTDTMKVSSKNKRIVKIRKYSMKKRNAFISVKGVKRGKTSVVFKLGSKKAKVSVKVS